MITYENGVLTIEDAHFTYQPNFEGRGTEYNNEGSRNFTIDIDDEEIANRMNQDGWNVKVRKSKDPQDIPMFFIKVNVNYRNTRKVPRVYMHTGKAVKELNEDTIGELDSADILGMDMTILPYHWERQNNSGLSAYLDTMHVVIKGDPFAHKYADLEG